uniref:CTCK domain-containing protein n=1 Tax=Xiphophorus couchianus TaxID=32473 RepID=A0A3B5KQM0_9TELE
RTETLKLLICRGQVNIVSCDGKCPSASIYNYNINTYARFCKCCRETGLQRRSVQLYCSSNATWVSYSIQEPTDCSCHPGLTWTRRVRPKGAHGEDSLALGL